VQAHGVYRELPLDFGERVALVGRLQRELFDEGWALYGWPREVGGRGGNALHRAVVSDLLARNGYPPRSHLEHLDILVPALVRFGTPEVIDALLLPTLRADVRWCQGFSEPGAGSDLAALRTRARRQRDGGYRIDGHKVWTSWAHWATHCFVLARTGSDEARHRGLSAFVVPMDAPGVTATAIRQANGTDELAEVFFEGVEVPGAWRVGEEDEGWTVAMAILAGERGSYAWLRQAELLPVLERLSHDARAGDHARAIGESLTRLLALRCRSREVLEVLARDEQPGPASSVTKVLVIGGEQHLYDVARETLGPAFDLGLVPDAARWHEEYLRSRAAGIYGGTLQIQLGVIGRLMLSGGVATADDHDAAVRQSVAAAIAASEDGRAALDGLEWWEFAASPADDTGRAAFAAWFESEGAALATSPALAASACAALADALDEDPALFAHASSPRPGGANAVCGLDAATRFVAVEDAAGFLHVGPVEATRSAAGEALDAGLVCALEIVDTRAFRLADVDAEAAARARALARIAAA